MLSPALNLIVEHVALIIQGKQLLFLFVAVVLFFSALHRSQSLVSGYSPERGFSMATTEELMLK